MDVVMETVHSILVHRQAWDERIQRIILIIPQKPVRMEDRLGEQLLTEKKFYYLLTSDKPEAKSQSHRNWPLLCH